MGFDIECIIDIHTYPGEYFCPVCRTLVYPNEAFQSQCTHLYCKPCLAHIANGTRACPYDGYLVTEADSKPLMDSDKALAENIGKVKVHCLYFRSGCTWEGSLSDCTSHCAACSFGNSPVICNRCGIQIVHRQVHDHAQSCPGMYGGQQAVGAASATTRPGTTASSAAADVNLSAAQSGAPSQVQNAQSVAPTPVPGQNPVQLVNVNSQGPTAAPVNATTPDQWYQQQYQQYYQQYMGYYQQPSQQYYQLQQQPFQQYQQHPAQVSGQLQPQVHPQSLAQPQAQPHPQSQVQPQPQQQPHSHPLPVSQAPQQPHLQPQAQGQAQQTQLQMPVPVQPQAQLPPQPQVQGHAPVQGSAPYYQVNPQQLPHPPLRPQTQAALPPPPHSHSGQPPQFPQGVGMRPPAQPAQLPQYQQPQMQPHLHASQFPVQPQMQPQSQPQPGSSNLSHAQTQPQVQPYPAPSPAHGFPPQANQSTGPTAVPQAPHLPGPPVSGRQSYQQPNPGQKVQPGSSQQHPVHPHPANPPVHPAQVHGQVPLQPGVMRPPPQVSVPQQQSATLLPLQGQVPFIPAPQHQRFPPHAQPTHAVPNRPVMQPVQQALPQQYGQQPHFPSHQSQLQQQPIQSQARPSGPPQLPQSNYAGRPMMPNQGIPPQNQPFPPDVGPLSHSGPAQHLPTQMVASQNYTKSTGLERNETVQETGSPSQVGIEKGIEGEILKEKVVTGHGETFVNETDRSKSAIKQDEDNVRGSMEQASVGKSFEAGTGVNESSEMEGHSVADSDSLKKVNTENQKLSTTIGPSSANYDKKSQNAISSSGTDGHLLPQPPSVPGPQGGGILPHPGQSLNPDEGRAHGYYGPPKGFEPQSTPRGPILPTQAYPHGNMGRLLPHEGQISKDQISGAANPSGTGEGNNAKSHLEEPSFFRTNGGTAPESMYGSKDEKMSREHLNPLPGEPNRPRPFDQASRSLDKVSHGPINEAGPKMNLGALGPHPRFLPPHDPSGGHGNVDMFGVGPGQHHMKHFPRQSPGGEYFGSSPHGFGDPASFPRGTSSFDDIASREVHRFGEGSRPFNLSSGRPGNPFHDGRFPPLPGPPRGDLDGSGNPRFDEFRAAGSDDAFGPDGPGHLARGKFSGPGFFPGNFGMAEPPGPGAFPGHGRPRELGGPMNYPRPPFNEPVRGDRFAPFGEPAMHSNFPPPAFPNAGGFSNGMDSFEPWKRKPVSTGWCRICDIDCESVEGLELHSQTREHQKLAMDMVKNIKLQNKKQRTGGPMVHDSGGRNRKAGIVGRGSNP